MYPLGTYFIIKQVSYESACVSVLLHLRVNLNWVNVSELNALE